MRFNDSIYYINASHFHKLIDEIFPLKINHETKNCLNVIKTSYTSSFLKKHNFLLNIQNCKGKPKDSSGNENEEELMKKQEINAKKPIKFFILDCSMVNRIDEDGIKILKKVMSFFNIFSNIYLLNN